MLRICIAKKGHKKARRNNASTRFPTHPRPDSDRDGRPAHYLILLITSLYLSYCNKCSRHAEERPALRIQ